MLICISYIFLLRSSAVDQGREGDEDAWGFGQAVPMFLLIIPLATVVETTYGMSHVHPSDEPELTDHTTDAFKKRHGISTQHAHQSDEEQPSNPLTIASNIPEEPGSYTIHWDNQAEPSATSWISAVEVTSTTGTDTEMLLQPMGNAPHSTSSQTFRPDVGAWTSLSLHPSGKNKRSTSAGYYFGSSSPFTTAEGHSRIGDVNMDWEMENELYQRRGFRIAMLSVLALLFCFLTALGGGLIWAMRYS